MLHAEFLIPITNSISVYVNGASHAYITIAIALKLKYENLYSSLKSKDPREIGYQY